MKNQNHPFQSRISYKGNMVVLLNRITKLYNLGKYKKHSIIGIGYEDFNVKLITARGNYLLKFFADFRNEEECLRYVNIMIAAIKAGINHPKLYKSDQGYLSKISIDNTEIRLVVTDFIEGKTFYQLKTKPSLEERDFIIEQAAKINQLKIKPKYLYDSWAIVNFVKEYEVVKNKLELEDVKLINPLYQEFKKIKIENLPHCFVHGDIIDTNVIRAKNGDLYILDFAVANTYPRIQELAVLLSDILFDYKKRDDFQETYKKTITNYQKIITLTNEELKHLPLFIKVAHAMHIIGATKANVGDELDDENNHWISVGRQGMRYNIHL